MPLLRREHDGALYYSKILRVYFLDLAHELQSYSLLSNSIDT